jgi:acetyl-CoA carboxylase carboxyltransferase component
MSMAPVVSAAMGAVAGLPAARMAMAHFAIMVRDAVIFAGGPPLVERALGRRVTKEDLGGARVHAEVSGLVDNVAADEEDCLRQIRRFLSYLPTNVWEQPAWRPSDDDPARRDEALASIIPRDRRQPYDARRIVAGVLDSGTFFELTAGFGTSLITGLARADGYPLGVIANDPRHLGGAMDAAAADKMTRFVDLCDTFHLPILSIEDEPGYMIGPEAEQAGTLRSGVRALAAVKQTTVPWITFIVRRAYGVAAGVHLGTSGLLYAWPSAEWGSIPIEGGVAAAYRREIAAAPDPERRRRELEASHEGDRSPFPRAEAFGLHDLVDPRDTRRLVVSFVRRAYKTLQSEIGVKRRTLRP